MRRLMAFTAAGLALAAIAGPLAGAPRPQPFPAGEETSPCTSLDADSGRPLSARELVPPEIRLCEAAVVSTTVRVSCGEIALHVVLNVDRSGSMVGQAWTEAVNAATALIQALDLNSHPQTEVALVTHGINANRDVRLTNQGNRVIGRLRGLTPGGEDNLPEAIDVSRTELIQGRPRDRSEPQPFDAMVILSDGGQTFPPTNAVRSAGRAKAAGILVVAVCTENAFSACPQVRQMASGARYYFQTRGTSGLTRVFREIADDLRDISLRQLAVAETVPEGLNLVADSAVPPAQLDPTGRTLSWQFRFVPGSGVTYTYAVTPSDVTTYSLAIATVTFQDSQDRTGVAVMPTAVLTVTGDCAVPTATPTLGPSATPTPTVVPSPTPTPTPIPGVAYLPILGFGRCLERDRPLDVALAIDASTSMGGATSAGRSKLDAAKEGARHFVDLMAPGERAAVLAFNSMVDLRIPLTGDKAALGTAIDGIVMSPGTRIDLALSEAAGEVMGPGRQPGAARVIVLLTDGQPTGTTPAAVLAAAQAAREAGIVVFTIGLGADVDAPLLVDVAGSPDRYFFAPDGEDLRRIYAAVREKLPCGRSPGTQEPSLSPAGPPLVPHQGNETHLP